MGPAGGAEGPPLRLHLDWKVLVTEADPELSRAPQTALKWARDPVLSSSSHCSEEGPRLSPGAGKACVTCFPIQSAWSTVPSTPGVLSPPGVGRSRLPLRANVRRTLWSPAPEQHSGKRGPGPRTDGEQSLNGKGGGGHCGLFLRKAPTMNKALKIHTQTSRLGNWSNHVKMEEGLQEPCPGETPAPGRWGRPGHRLVCGCVLGRNRTLSGRWHPIASFLLGGSVMWNHLGL